MTATNHDGHKRQTMTMMATTMTATNMFSDDSMTVNSPRIWRFLKSVPLIFHVLIAVAIMVYHVAVMVCGHHGCFCRGLWPSWYTMWPSWFVAIMVVSVVVCGHHGIGIPCGRHGLWPSWHRPFVCACGVISVAVLRELQRNVHW